MKRNLTTAQVLYLLDFYGGMNEAKLNELGIKVRWALKRAVSSVYPIAKQFEDFRKEEIEKIRAEYATPEKSVIEQDGEETKRSIKDEFKEAYQKDLDSLNKTLRELLDEQHEFEYGGVNMDTVVESLPDDSVFTFKDLEILSDFIGEDR